MKHWEQNFWEFFESTWIWKISSRFPAFHGTLRFRPAQPVGSTQRISGGDFFVVEPLDGAMQSGTSSGRVPGRDVVKSKTKSTKASTGDLEAGKSHKIGETPN